MIDYRGVPFIAQFAWRLFNDSFIDMTQGTYSFIGLNYYMPLYLTPPLLRKQMRKSDFGWPIDSAGLYNVVMHTWKRYHLPIYITENGVSDSKDSLRPGFVTDHLASLLAAIQNGADVRGYYYWSLYDNFEWAEGYKQKFGLFEIDFHDPVLKRIQRESAELYGRIAKTGHLPGLSKGDSSPARDAK
jgi:beta-glucosidase